MSYTQKRFPAIPGELPPPPLWLTWAAYPRYVYDRAARTYSPRPEDIGKGQVRHYPTLAKCKKSMGGWSGAEDEWRTDWKIYEWVNGKYVLRYEAFKGEKKAKHPLFRKRLTKADHLEPVQDVDEEELAATLASIAKAATNTPKKAS